MLFFALKSPMGAAAAASTIKRSNNPNDTGLFIQLEQLLHAIPRPGKGGGRLSEEPLQVLLEGARFFGSAD